MSASRTPADDSIAARLERAGVSRRNFITFCGKLMVVAPVGLAITNHLSPELVAAEVGKAKRPSVIWLQSILSHRIREQSTNRVETS